MRPTLRTMQAASKALHRHREASTSFIGLGRMGYQMALNLFSKQYKEDTSARFVVCDALPDSARSFCETFSSQHPEAHISIAANPEECVTFLEHWLLF